MDPLDRREPLDRTARTARTARKDEGQNWVDAVVTLLATILFGLSWTLVELERAEPFETGYAAPAAWDRDAGADPTFSARESLGRADGVEPWTELAQQSSKR
jgi:hypothetical protein